MRSSSRERRGPTTFYDDGNTPSLSSSLSSALFPRPLSLHPRLVTTMTIREPTVENCQLPSQLLQARTQVDRSWRRKFPRSR
eukprot:766806-Hanusia_phi.AAC.1